MKLTVADEPPDRPAWISETIRLLTAETGDLRERLLVRVAASGDADLVAGTPDDWGIGQVSVHLLLVERGVWRIALRLALRGETGATGQPRPAASGVTRAGIASLAQKAAAAADELRAGFPDAADVVATGRHPFYGDLNCFGWLLTLPNHYRAHLEALERETASAL